MRRWEQDIRQWVVDTFAFKADAKFMKEQLRELQVEVEALKRHLQVKVVRIPEQTVMRKESE